MKITDIADRYDAVGCITRKPQMNANYRQSTRMIFDLQFYGVYDDLR
jgi:hypothetical protein